MPSALDVLNTKGSSFIHSIEPQATVMAAIHKMNQHKLGALIVMERGRVAGMFTERDVLRRVVGEGRDPSTATVADVMTSDVICVGPTTDIDDISAIMQQRRIRHVPVCDQDQELLGMISIGDLNAFHASHQEAHIHFLSEYIYGRA
jgi:CBS domain-containing protein